MKYQLSPVPVLPPTRECIVKRRDQTKINEDSFNRVDDPHFLWDPLAFPVPSPFGRDKTGISSISVL